MLVYGQEGDQQGDDAWHRFQEGERGDGRRREAAFLRFPAGYAWLGLREVEGGFQVQEGLAEHAEEEMKTSPDAVLATSGLAVPTTLRHVVHATSRHVVPATSRHVVPVT